MTTILNWKVFISLLEKRCNYPFVIYGRTFPSLSFCLPEQGQVNNLVKDPVYFIIPKSSHIDDIIETMSSVVDIEWEGSSGSEGFISKTGLSIIKSPYSNGESSGEIQKPEVFNNLNAPSYKTINYKFTKNVLLDLEYSARVNKVPISFNIQKWKFDSIEEIVKELYNRADYSSEIPVIHNGKNFEIPELFDERFRTSLNCTVIQLNGKAPDFPALRSGDFNKWLTLKKT